MKNKIQTEQAPKAIGPYSQAIRMGNTIYLSGQIPLDPESMMLCSDDFKAQSEQVFKNMQAVCKASGGDLNAIVKLNVFLIDLAQFSIFNEVMQQFFKEPFPARSTIQVSALPKSAKVEVEAIMVL